ncbi:hydroxymethylglutaryl-CoA synthase [Candidatus Gottesmanbacteria bacterium]|nr:hydroxymethylglutaryl-CoA synthase [Candidatus Gottesmanbacteria bacterium]
MNVGILGYGVYIPLYRVKTADTASVWGKNPRELVSSLSVGEKSVAGYDEDAVTLAYEASKYAFEYANINPSRVDVCFVGSESHPYAVNPTSTIVAEFLGIGKNYLASDLEFACKAATTGLIAISALVESKKAEVGLCIGTDTAQAKPHDILEYTAASAASSYLIGRNSPEAIATLLDWTSYSSDTPDFWRRDGVKFPTHGGRFTGTPSYYAHVEGAARQLFSKTKTDASDFDYCVFHMPNGKFPRDVARRLGFSEKQLAPSLTVDFIGNPYSASSLIGLSAVLDIAKPKQKIFMASYGSGAGSDAFVFETTSAITKKRGKVPHVSDFMKKKRYISYVEYLRMGGKI